MSSSVTAPPSSAPAPPPSVESDAPTAEPVSGRTAAVAAMRELMANTRAADSGELEAAPVSDAPSAQPPPAPEAAAEEPKKPSAKEWAEWNKRNRDLEQRERAAKKAEVEVDDARKAKAMFDRAKANPIEFVNELIGNTDWHEDLIKRYATGDGKPTVDEEIRALKKQLDDERTARQQAIDDAVAKKAKEVEDASAGERQAHIYISRIDELLKDDRYELTARHPHGRAEVIRLAQQAWAEKGKVLTADDAVAMIEAELEIQAKALVGAKKFQLPPVDPPPAVDTYEQTRRAASSGPRATGPRTLTQKLTAEPPPRDRKPLTDAERRRLAVEELRRRRGQ